MNASRMRGLLMAVGIALTAAMTWAQTPPENSAPSPVAPADAPVAAPVAPAAPVVEAVTPPVAAPAPSPGLLSVPTTPTGAVQAAGKGPGGGVTVQLESVPLPQVVQMFTRVSGANIVAGPLPNTNITANLQDVPWDQAMKVILGTVGLALSEQEGNIYQIVPKSQLAVVEPIVSDTIFLNYSTVSNILPVVKAMLGTNGSFSAHPASNALIIQDTSSRVKRVREVIAQLDKPRDQVLIEAKFVELNDSAIKDLGINWQSLESYGIRAKGLEKRREEITLDLEGDRFTDFTAPREEQPAKVTFDQSSSRVRTDTLTTKDSSSSLKDSVNGNSKTGTRSSSRDIIDVAGLTDGVIDTSVDYVNSLTTAILSADEFQLTLSALKQNNGVEIVSNPKIMVASGDTATIHVGTQEPNVVAESQNSGGGALLTTYELSQDLPWIEVGVKLKVSPTVNTESNITIRITPELSTKVEDKVYGELGTSFPVLRTRKIETEFQLESGRTVAIGGLTSSADQEKVTKIPLLGDIPVIGKYLFSHTHTEKEQDEVIIFVTVYGAKPSSLSQIAGIPEEGKLVHEYIARKDVEKTGKKAESPTKKTGTKPGSKPTASATDKK